MEFSHFNKQGLPKMVDVGDKPDTKRIALAKCFLSMHNSTIDLIKRKGIKKGDVLTVAQIAGICGAKKTSDIIPMTHNICLTGVDIRFDILDGKIEIESEVSTIGKTGVEIEALMSVSIAALTIYDMCKAVDKDMKITDIRLVKKVGGNTNLRLNL